VAYLCQQSPHFNALINGGASDHGQEQEQEKEHEAMCESKGNDGRDDENTTGSVIDSAFLRSMHNSLSGQVHRAAPSATCLGPPLTCLAAGQLIPAPVLMLQLVWVLVHLILYPARRM
jgi:hypothetical protein